MADPTTTRIGIPYPVGGDAVSAWPASMQSAANVIDGLWGRDMADVLKGGVAGTASVPNASGPTINTATGALTFTLNADFAWVTVSGVLTRVAMPTAATPFTPTLPTSGNFRCVGLYVSPLGTWGQTGQLAIATGTSQTTANLAIANPPATPAGSLLIEYVIITFNGTVYSINTTIDARVWALQVTSQELAAGAVTLNSLSNAVYPLGVTTTGTSAGDYSTVSGTYADIDTTNLSIPLVVPTGGLMLEFGFDYHFANNSGASGIAGKICIRTTLGPTIIRESYIPPAEAILTPQHSTWIFRASVVAGSHVFRPQFLLSTGTQFYISGLVPLQASFWVRQPIERAV